MISFDYERDVLNQLVVTLNGPGLAVEIAA